MNARALKELPDALPGRFCRRYPEITGGACPISETATHQRVLREKIVRCLWFDQFLDPESLRLEDGRRVSVFSPGYWSEVSGPDFRNAEFSLDDGPRQRGDVEIHVNASEWRAHGHTDDPAYDKVLLHVVLHNDIKANSVTQRGREIPQLVLERHLSADLDEILGGLDPDGYPRVGSGREGNCGRSIRALGRTPVWVGRFLDIAGDERMLRKAERFAAQMKAATPDDALYEMLLDAMGYSANRRGFRQLAVAMPLDRLRGLVPRDDSPQEKLLSTQAILLGAAGFLDRAEPIADPESAAAHAEMLRRWSAVCARRANAIATPIAWSLGHTRPTNHPIRRIAGISAFLASHMHDGLCRALMMGIERLPSGGNPRTYRQGLAEFARIFEPEPQPFWTRRTGFAPARLPRPTALIGPARTTEMIVNVAIPLLLALSKQEAQHAEERLHRLYCALRPLSENSLTEYMKSRIFESEEAADRVVSSLRRQQGLLQIFHDYCESGQGTCEQCGFLAAVEGWNE